MPLALLQQTWSQSQKLHFQSTETADETADSPFLYGIGKGKNSASEMRNEIKLICFPCPGSLTFYMECWHPGFLFVCFFLNDLSIGRRGNWGRENWKGNYCLVTRKIREVNSVLAYFLGHEKVHHHVLFLPMRMYRNKGQKVKQDKTTQFLLGGTWCWQLVLNRAVKAFVFVFNCIVFWNVETALLYYEDLSFIVMVIVFKSGHQIYVLMAQMLWAI